MNLANVSNTQLLDFASSFLSKIEITPVASLSKTELEFQVFAAQVEAELLDLAWTDFELGLALSISSSKAANLRRKYRLSTVADAAKHIQFAEHVIIGPYDPVSETLSVSIHDIFYLEMLKSELQRIGAFSDASFNAKVIRLHPNALFEVLSHLSGKASEPLKVSVESTLRATKRSAQAQVFRNLFVNVGSEVLGQTLLKVTGLA